MEDMQSIICIDPYLDVTENPGKWMAAISSMFTILFIMTNMYLYNCCSFRMSRQECKSTITIMDKSLVAFYCLSCIIFELQIVYGHEISKSYQTIPTENVTLTTMFAWFAANALSAFGLVTACCSRSHFRVLIYIPFAFHLAAQTVIFMDMLVRPILGANLIIVSLMAIQAIVLVTNVPKCLAFNELSIEKKDKNDTDGVYHVLTEDMGLVTDSTVKDE